jgi:hypothetical protein
MLMKKTFIFLFILSFSTLFAQNNKQAISQDSLIGIWQADNNLLAAGLADNYQFFKDNTFKYNFNSMSCGLRRLWSILGNYKLINNELILTINSTFESVGGHIIAGGTEEGENGFQIVDDKMEIKNQDKPSIIHFALDNNDEKEHSLEINFRKFFKLSSNPNAFK